MQSKARSWIRVVQLEITRNCNLSCSFCRIRPDGHEMSSAQLRLVLRALCETPVTHVTLTGGEPTLCRSLVSATEFLLSRGRHVTIVSNGTALPGHLRSLVLGGRASLAVSLHSHLSDVHDRLVGMPGSWGRVLQTLESLTGSRARVYMNSTAMKTNASEAFKFIEAFSRVEGIVQFNFNKFIARAPHDRRSLSSADIKNLLRTLDAAHREFGVKVRIDAYPLCAVDKRFHYLIEPCAAGRSYMYIDVLGNVRPCVFSDRVLLNIISHPRALPNLCYPTSSLASDLLSGRAPCKDCPDLSRCGAGCSYFRSSARRSPNRARG